MLNVLSVPKTPNTFLVPRISCNVGFSEVSNLNFNNESKESSCLVEIESSILLYVMMLSALLKYLQQIFILDSLHADVTSVLDEVSLHPTMQTWFHS